MSHSPHPEAGRTLIELLIAMTLGLLLAGAVAALYLASSQTTRSQAGLSNTEEQGTVMLYLIGSAVKRAGYGEIIGTSISPNQALATRENLTYTGPSIRGCTNGRFTDPANGDFSCAAHTGGSAGDTLAVWFQSDTVMTVSQAATFDCLGRAAPGVLSGNPSFAPRFPVAVGTGAGAGTGIPVVNNVYGVVNGQLRCQGIDPNDTEAAADVLGDNVLEFRLFYGFDEVGFANPAALSDRPAQRRIVDATFLNGLANIGALSPWDFVVSVHACLMLRTADGGVAATAGAEVEACPTTAAEAATQAGLIASPAPGAIVRTYNQVFTIRSRATPSPLRPT